MESRHRGMRAPTVVCAGLKWRYPPYTTAGARKQREANTLLKFPFPEWKGSKIPLFKNSGLKSCRSLQKMVLY